MLHGVKLNCVAGTWNELSFVRIVPSANSIVGILPAFTSEPFVLTSVI
jgi:hypothetical protein